MVASCLSVISSPLGTPLTYLSIVSSSERSPSPAAWRSRVAVKVLVTLPIRWYTSGVMGRSEVRFATPRARIHVYWGVCTAATTPGVALCLKDFLSAASRSAVDDCSPPPLAWEPAAECSSWPPPPPQLLISIAANTITTSPISRPRCIPHTKNISPLLVAARYGATVRNPVLPLCPSFREPDMAELLRTPYLRTSQNSPSETVRKG